MSDEREVTIIEAEGASGVKWFLLGAALGAGLGLLLAPQSGERTRRDITRKARQLQRQAGEKLGELADEVEDRGRQIKESAEELIDEVEDRGRRVRASAEDFVEELADGVRETHRRVERKASTARDELDRRLADARARRRAALAADEEPDADATE